MMLNYSGFQSSEMRELLYISNSLYIKELLSLSLKVSGSTLPQSIHSNFIYLFLFIYLFIIFFAAAATE